MVGLELGPPACKFHAKPIKLFLSPKWCFLHPQFSSPCIFIFGWIKHMIQSLFKKDPEESSPLLSWNLQFLGQDYFKLGEKRRIFTMQIRCPRMTRQLHPTYTCTLYLLLCFWYTASTYCVHVVTRGPWAALAPLHWQSIFIHCAHHLMDLFLDKRLPWSSGKFSLIISWMT